MDDLNRWDNRSLHEYAVHCTWLHHHAPLSTYAWIFCCMNGWATLIGVCRQRVCQTGFAMCTGVRARTSPMLLVAVVDAPFSKNIWIITD